MCCTLALLASACHEDNIGQTPGLLPQATDNEEPTIPAGDELSLQLPPFRPSVRLDRSGWQTGYIRFDQRAFEYKLPPQWDVERTGAEGPGGEARMRSTHTNFAVSELTVAAYAARLEEDEPVRTLRIAKRRVAYVVRRQVPLVLGDPEFGTYTFTSVIFGMNGRIARIEFRYETTDAWRFRDVVENSIDTMRLLPLPMSEAEFRRLQSCVRSHVVPDRQCRPEQ